MFFSQSQLNDVSVTSSCRCCRLFSSTFLCTHTLHHNAAGFGSILYDIPTKQNKTNNCLLLFCFDAIRTFTSFRFGENVCINGGYDHLMCVRMSKALFDTWTQLNFWGVLISQGNRSVENVVWTHRILAFDNDLDREMFPFRVWLLLILLPMVVFYTELFNIRFYLVVLNWLSAQQNAWFCTQKR